MDDDRVRPSHKAAHGQQQPAGVPFEIGESRLMFPGDPDGPDHEVMGCRCRLTFRVARTARLLLPPVIE